MHKRNRHDESGSKPISSLFDKYKKNLKAPQGSVIKITIEVIDDLIGVEIPKERISYSPYSKTLDFRVAGPLKTEILLHKKEILAHIRGRIGSGSCPTEIL